MWEADSSGPCVRQVNYADYAYFDPDNHANLLQAIRDSAAMKPDEDM